MLCATGRCLLRESEPDGSMRPLRWDDAGPWEFWLTVTPDDTGKTYAISGELRRGGERLALETPLLLLSGGLVFWEDRVAPLLDFGAFQWIALLRQQGKVSVPAKQKQEFLAELLRLPDLPRLDLPEDMRYEEVAPAPRPYLTIKRRDVRRWMSDRDQNWLIGDLSFEYDGHVVPAQSPARSVFEPEKRRLLLRDPAAERSFAARLEEVGFHRRTDYRQGETLELLARNLPKAARALLQEGWRVEAEGKLYRQAGDFRIEVTSGIDWFELHGGVTFGDQEVPLPTLLAALRRGEDLVPLGDGSFGLLPEEWLKKYVTLAGLGTPEGDHLRFRRTQVGLLDVLLAEQPEARFDERFERARERLRQFQGIAPADPPAGFQGQLRGYQRDGLGWLHFLREFGFGGCLADDMGLGKTVQVLALLEARRELRAAPGNAADPRRRWSWCRGRWSSTGSRRPPASRRSCASSTIPASAAASPGEHFDDYDVVLTTYGTLRRDIVDLKDYQFDYAILDEAQAIKNASSQSAKAARLIRARAPPGPQRHAGREPPRRAVEPVRVPQPGHARQGRGVRQGRRRPPQARRGDAGRSWRRRSAVPPPPHQGAGREGPAREVRADDLLRPGTRPAQALRRAARALPASRCSGASRATGSRSRRSRSSRRCCACGRRPAIPA